MDSEEFQPFSQSHITDSSDAIQSLNSIGLQSQSPTNRMISSSFQYQPTFPLFSSQSQQQYGQNFSYQGLLGAPNWISMTPFTEPSKLSHKKNKSTLNPEKNPATVRRWTLDEDIALTKARLHVSCDADTGAGQKSETLWSRIFQVWRDNMGEFDRTRDSNALECRWSRLEAAINKFHGCYERLERMKKSGTTLDDVKRAALRTFQDTNNNQSFKHEECWEICRQNAKWCTQHLTKQDGSKKRKCSVDLSNENPPNSKQTQSDPISIPDSNENGCSETKIDELDNTKDEGVARPTVGRKGIKDQKKRLVAEKGVVEALGNLQTSLERQFDLNREELDMKKEREKKEYELKEKMLNAEIELKRSNQMMKQKALKRHEDERILEKDLTKLSPNVRKKFEIMQARILKEWENDGFFGDVSSNDDIGL